MNDRLEGVGKQVNNLDPLDSQLLGDASVSILMGGKGGW